MILLCEEFIICTKGQTHEQMLETGYRLFGLFLLSWLQGGKTEEEVMRQVHRYQEHYRRQEGEMQRASAGEAGQ